MNVDSPQTNHIMQPCVSTMDARLSTELSVHFRIDIRDDCMTLASPLKTLEFHGVQRKQMNSGTSSLDLECLATVLIAARPWTVLLGFIDCSTK